MQDSQVFKGDGIHKALAGRSEAGPDLISMILVPSSLVGVSVAVLQLLQVWSVSRLNSYSFRKSSGSTSSSRHPRCMVLLWQCPKLLEAGWPCTVCAIRTYLDHSGPVQDCGLPIWTPRWCRNSELSVSVAQCFQSQSRPSTAFPGPSTSQDSLI